MKIEGSVFQVENAQTYEKDDTKCSGREDLPRKVPNRASTAQFAVTSEISSVAGAFAQIPRNPFSRSRPGDTACIFQHQCVPVCELRYESSTLILCKELSSSIFQSCQSVCQASVTPVQISTLCNI